MMSENKKTIVIFSGDLDKAMAAMIIASGAAAMGNDVTLFFTFWGLNLLRKPAAIHVKKNLLEAMFGWMMPRGAQRATLSKMHMGGMGTAMMKYVMKTKNVATPEGLLRDAQAMGVTFIACTMSMDIMGIKPEELIDGVEFGGVASYLGCADDANVNLFI
jgi:peroxiredoxin family protein